MMSSDFARMSCCGASSCNTLSRKMRKASRCTGSDCSNGSSTAWSPFAPRCRSARKRREMSSVPYPRRKQEDGMHSPSSTAVTEVLVAPMSTTHAVCAFAWKAAHEASCTIKMLRKRSSLMTRSTRSFVSVLHTFAGTTSTHAIPVTSVRDRPTTSLIACSQIATRSEICSWGEARCTRRPRRMGDRTTYRAPSSRAAHDTLRASAPT
mmetsp:Transcript_35344/g.80425  ORF Transcript_35344/g.80425 Transcript_35344/m.80425 type:complete len:208 (-) Transcript_35344:99-722(-)